MIYQTWLVRGVAMVALAGATAAVVRVTDHHDVPSPHVHVLGESFANSTSNRESGAASSGRVAQPTTPGGNNAGGNGNGNANGLTKKNVTVDGVASGLYPGGSVPLLLTFTNPNSQKVNITDFTITPADASADCPGSLVGVDGITPVTVERNTTATLTVTLTLDPTTTNDCRNKSWVLHYSGTAQQA